ncbi:MAG: NAD(P)H-dependent oxidoreductase, partial [Pseudomonadota bacterium]
VIHLDSQKPGQSALDRKIVIVGVGGTLREGSSTERAVSDVLRHAETLGAETQMVAGPALAMPFYSTETDDRTVAAKTLVDALRRADGVVIGSPGYHGGVSGLLKNALDYVEDLRCDDRPYLDGRAVGLIASAAGEQAAMTTLGMLRDITHALRGVPTPYGCVFNSADKSQQRLDDTADKLKIVGEQVYTIATALSALRGG